jgi:hypothetical protein
MAGILSNLSSGSFGATPATAFSPIQPILLSLLQGQSGGFQEQDLLRFLPFLNSGAQGVNFLSGFKGGF